MQFDSQEKNVEWADLSVALSGARVGDLQGLKFSITTKKEHLHAEGDDPIGIQSGNREPKGELTVLKKVVDAMNLAAVAAGGRDLTDADWDIVSRWKPVGTRPPVTYTLKGAQFESFDIGAMQGDTSVKVTLPFLFMELLTAYS
jgi:hypothetical protein